MSLKHEPASEPQTFLSFQWDIFLLEIGGLAVLLAPKP